MEFDGDIRQLFVSLPLFQAEEIISAFQSHLAYGVIPSEGDSARACEITKTEYKRL